jgi:phosphoglycolate phosphatase
MYTTVIFDLDGTLLNTLDDLADSVNFALATYGLPTHTREKVCAFVGNGMQNLMQLAAGKQDKVDQDELLATFKAHYKKHCKDKTKPYDGIISLLRALKARGVKTAVLSNKADFATKKLVKEYFGEYITHAVGENEAAGIRKKPAPDALFTVMKDFGVTAEETLYVGDSEVDILTAKAAGVDCVSVLWGFKDRRFLIDNGATRLIEQPWQLLDEIE